MDKKNSSNNNNNLVDNEVFLRIIPSSSETSNLDNADNEEGQGPTRERTTSLQVIGKVISLEEMLHRSGDDPLGEVTTSSPSALTRLSYHHHCIRTIQTRTDMGITCMSILSNGILISCTSSGTIQLWDPESILATATPALPSSSYLSPQSNQCLQTYQYGAWIFACCSLANGGFACGGFENGLHIWEDTSSLLPSASTSRILRFFSWSGKTSHSRIDCLVTSVSAACQLPNTQLVTNTEDNQIAIWDLTTGKLVKILNKEHSQPIRCLGVMITRDSSHLLAQQQQQQQPLVGQPYHIISGSEDRTLKIWNLQRGECVKTLEGHQGYILCVYQMPNTVHPNGYIISGATDCTIRVWDPLANYEQTYTLCGHTSAVSGIAVCDNGHIVSCSYDHSIRIWDIKTGDCIDLLYGHSGPITSLLVLQDGQTIVSGSADKTIKLWRMSI